MIIAENFGIKSAPILSSNLLQYDKYLMDYFYNDYIFNESDNIPNKEYLIMFEFKNRKYLMCKLIGNRLV
jgi:hypothetical protein